MRCIVCCLTITPSCRVSSDPLFPASVYVGCGLIEELMLAENRNLGAKPEAKLKGNFVETFPAAQGSMRAQRGLARQLPFRGYTRTSRILYPFFDPCSSA
jgi:hypothetical protein